MAMARGALPVRTLEASSAKVTSLTWCRASTAGRDLLQRLRTRHRAITLVWADGGYTGWLVEFASTVLAIALTIVKRPDDARGFATSCHRPV
ncbi:hypothetical protein [Kitasatospora aureofaciens]|uniref:hypothetical protein n=1 Tax=Kitasatospora aureofaciens TaxID=1894 RepID=UPI0036F49C97